MVDDKLTGGINLVENLARANYNTAKVAIDKHPKQTRYLVLRE